MQMRCQYTFPAEAAVYSYDVPPIGHRYSSYDLATDTSPTPGTRSCTSTGLHNADASCRACSAKPSWRQQLQAAYSVGIRPQFLCQTAQVASASGKQQGNVAASTQQ